MKTFFKLIIWIYCAEVSAQIWGKFCESGLYCSHPKDCCGQGCCYPNQHNPFLTQTPSRQNVFDLYIFTHWYVWCLAITIVILAIWVLWLWRQGRIFCGFRRRDHHSERDSTGSCYYPPQYSRCNSIIHPPPYTEVTTKPDLYPLVLTYGDNRVRNTSNGYFMVQFFKNQIFSPTAGSVSAASTAESINSSLICNAANEANSVIPPPYSCAESFEEWQATNSNTNTQRQALLRSVSTMSWRQPAITPPTPTSAHIPLNVDSPSQNSSIIAQYFNERITSSITLDLESPDINPSYRDRMMTTIQQETKFNINDIDLDLIDYEINNFTELENNNDIQSETKITPQIIDNFNHVYAQIKRNCVSPPLPTSPTLRLHAPNQTVQGMLDHQDKTNKLLTQRKKHKPLSLNTSSSGNSSKCRQIFGAKMFSLSAPSTPCSVSFMPAILGVAQKNISKSGSHSKLKVNLEEIDPLLPQYDGDDKSNLHF